MNLESIIILQTVELVIAKSVKKKRANESYLARRQDVLDRTSAYQKEHREQSAAATRKWRKKEGKAEMCLIKNRDWLKRNPWKQKLYNGRNKKRLAADEKRFWKLQEIPDGHKKCPRCEEIKLLSEFHKQKNKADGLAAHCKSCIHIKSVAIYQKKKLGDEPTEWVTE